MRKTDLLPPVALAVSIASLIAAVSVHGSLKNDRAARDEGIAEINSQSAVETLIFTNGSGLEKQTRCQGNWCITEQAPVQLR